MTPSPNTTTPAAPPKLTGTPIANSLTASYGGKGNVAAHALDGQLGTYYDAQNPDGNWVGLAFAAPTHITSIAFAPRAGYEHRMVGGRFEGAQNPTFPAPTTLYTIDVAPQAGRLTPITLPVSAATYHYVRYVAPPGSYGNVAEVQFFGAVAGPIAVPAPQFPAPVIGIDGIVPPAGHAVHVRQDFTDDWRNHSIKATATTDAQPGPFTAFTAINGTIAQTIDATARPIQITVGTSARKLINAVPGVIPNAGPGVDYQCGAGDFIAPSFAGLKDVRLIGTPATRYIARNGSAFAFDANSENISIVGGGLVTSDTNATGGATGSFGHVKGTNIAFADLMLGALAQGLSLEGVDGLLLLRMTCATPVSCEGQNVMALSVRRMIMAHCNWLGSRWQSPIRSTKGDPSDIGVADSAFIDTIIGPSANGGIACATIRAGDNLYFDGITCNGGAFSIRTGGAETVNGKPSLTTTTTRWLVRNLTINGGKIELGDGASDGIIDGANITNPDAECVSVTSGGAVPVPSAGLQLVLKNITGRSGHKLLKVYGAVRSGVDVKAMACSLLSASLKTPFATDGSNNVLNPALFGAANLVKAA